MGIFRRKERVPLTPEEEKARWLQSFDEFDYTMTIGSIEGRSSRSDVIDEMIEEMRAKGFSDVEIRAEVIAFNKSVADLLEKSASQPWDDVDPRGVDILVRSLEIDFIPED